MSCYRCPHYVRHGQITKDNNLVFSNLCGLKMKQAIDPELLQLKKTRGRRPVEPPKKKHPKEDNLDCAHFPFPQVFDYFQCDTYRKTFESTGLKNDVIPTKDFQYSEQLRGISVTEMEFL